MRVPREYKQVGKILWEGDTFERCIQRRFCYLDKLEARGK